MHDYISEAQALFEYTQFMRRDFHAHPELGFQEIRTAGIVARELKTLGLDTYTGVAGTGIIARLESARSGPVVLVRADMDALPINEETGAAYASQNTGIMHACGHDGHTAILLTVAKILVSHRDELPGTVKFMFQPAEEGMGGAEKMIEEGVLENPKVDLALALHLWNEKPVGWLGIPNGPAMAGAEIFKIKIIGKGGHGAAPHLTVDPVLAAAQIVTALQGIVARNVAPLLTAVVSVCTIHGGRPSMSSHRRSIFPVRSVRLTRRCASGYYNVLKRLFVGSRERWNVRRRSIYSVLPRQPSTIRIPQELFNRLQGASSLRRK